MSPFPQLNYPRSRKITVIVMTPQRHPRTLCRMWRGYVVCQDKATFPRGVNSDATLTKLTPMSQPYIQVPLLPLPPCNGRGQKSYGVKRHSTFFALVARQASPKHLYFASASLKFVHFRLASESTHASRKTTNLSMMNLF